MAAAGGSKRSHSPPMPLIQLLNSPVTDSGTEGCSTFLCSASATLGGCSHTAVVAVMSTSDGLSTVPSWGRRLG